MTCTFDVGDGIQPVNAIDELLELVPGPRVGHEDDIAAARIRMALGHAVNPLQCDGDVAAGTRELSGNLATPGG